MTPIVLGVDPGFACLGLARVALTPLAEIVERLGVIRTSPANGARATEDTVRRAGELARELDRWVTPDVVAICTEAQSWPRNAVVGSRLGMAWGVVSALAALHAIPIVQVAPMELKRALTGNKRASKEEVQVALEVRYPDLPDWPRPASIVEHAADALGAIVACLDRDLLRVARGAGRLTCASPSLAAGAAQ